LKVDPTTTFSIANSIWYRNTLTVKNNFISVNKDYYNAEVKSLDFNSPNAVKQINGWASDKTNKKIPEVINEIPGNAMMYLINATYFKGIWNLKFDKSNTTEEDFYPEGNLNSYKVKMMKQKESFQYSEDDNCRYLKMVYGNKAFSMIVMLPQDGKTIDDVISNLNNESWHNAMQMHSFEVNLRLPRFKSECKYEMSESILPAMGMNIPFTEFADFSGITNDASLMISRVIHKTFVDVNEEGTEAAAVTAVVMVNTSIDPTPGTIIDYAVNKPFAFAICENSTGVILFMGKMSDIH
jgi:serpin B